jgi:protein-disulfide isomerase
MIKRFLNIFYKKEFPTKIFVAASILALLLLIIIILFFRFGFYLEKTESVAPQLFLGEDNSDPLITKEFSLKDRIDGPIISQDDPGIGLVGAKVNIVLFSDYKCSYCQKQEEVLKEILDKYKGKIRLTWKDFPGDVDLLSWQASIAGRCAQTQGKFWEYHDQLFANLQNREKADNKFFIDLAVKNGLNREIFSNCLDNQAIVDLVTNNILEAQALDIVGVPFIFINDKGITGGTSIEDLEKMVETELNK